MDFKVGDVVRHRLSGERAVVVANSAIDTQQVKSTGQLTVDYGRTALVYSACDMNYAKLVFEVIGHIADKEFDMPKWSDVPQPAPGHEPLPVKHNVVYKTAAAVEKEFSLPPGSLVGRAGDFVVVDLHGNPIPARDLNWPSGEGPVEYDPMNMLDIRNGNDPRDAPPDPTVTLHVGHGVKDYTEAEIREAQREFLDCVPPECMTPENRKLVYACLSAAAKMVNRPPAALDPDLPRRFRWTHRGDIGGFGAYFAHNQLYWLDSWREHGQAFRYPLPDVITITAWIDPSPEGVK